MSMSSKPARQTPTFTKGGNTFPSSSNSQNTVPRQQFVSMVLNMSWQLAVVVLVPTIGGVLLDKKLNTSPILLLVGLAVALLGSIAVMWRTMQVANRLPVPKLTAAQKRAVQKSYEEDDNE